MTNNGVESVSIISDTPTGTRLVRAIMRLGYTVRAFPTCSDYVSPDRPPENAIFVELDQCALWGDNPISALDFLKKCNFCTEMVFLYCEADLLSPFYLSADDLAPILVNFPVPLCYLPTPVDITIVTQILQEREDNFVKTHDLRYASILMEIFKHLTDFRHELQNCMAGIGSLLRSLGRSPSNLFYLVDDMPREKDGQIRPVALTNRYQEKIVPLIKVLPNYLITRAEKKHEGVLALADVLNTGLLKLLSEPDDVISFNSQVLKADDKNEIISLSSQVLKADDEFEVYTKSFKESLLKTAKGMIGQHE